MTGSSMDSGWRARKKEATRLRLKEHAMRLFLAKGYEATTIEEISSAAGVSHMTFFRYYPTKEHVASSDDYEPLLPDLVLARPADEPIIEKMRHAFLAAVSHLYQGDRHALLARNRLIFENSTLRARHWENQNATQKLIVRALMERAGDASDELLIRTQVATSLAAAATAVLAWTEAEMTAELPELLDRVFDVLCDGVQ